MSLLDDPEIKKLRIQFDTTVIWRKAVDLISKRMDSGEMTDSMLLRTIVCLGKSTVPNDLPRRPRRRRSRSGLEHRARPDLAV
jgi:hypothetical protein